MSMAGRSGLSGAVALRLLLAGPARVSGFDGGHVGMALLMAAAWVKLQRAKPFVIGNLWVFASMWGWLCGYAATALLYWRDRR